MITLVDNEYYVDTAAELFSWDVSSIAMGTKSYVIESGKKYVLNGSKKWKELYHGGFKPNGSSGDGDKKSGGIFVITLGGTTNNPTVDKTNAEIKAAWDAGLLPIMIGGSLVLNLVSIDSTTASFMSGMIMESTNKSLSVKSIIISNDTVYSNDATFIQQ